MTDQDDVNDIAEARALREKAVEALVEAEQHRTLLGPIFERLNSRRIENSFGREYDLSITPIGRKSA